MDMDYEKIGLKSGIEIHQQLDTGKLFCKCPSVLRKDEPDFHVERKLHAMAGESGKIDEAVKHEAALGKKFIYEGYDDTTCLIELDEAPPFPINQTALRITLQVALLLNCEILNTTQIMRKTVIDGSNTGGFQRTVLIARNGYIETSSGKIRIESICLEEDAARIISKDNEKVIYRLDRLGIPLIEIATAPDIKLPSQAKEVALFIGDILRSVKVKRGIGTIRQDVNISIKGHPRIEIKGVQEPKLIEKTILSEIKRQQENIQKNQLKQEVRKANPDGSTSFMRPMPGAARMYPETDLPILKISKKQIDEIKKTLPKIKSELKAEAKSTGLTDEMTGLLFKENKYEDFKELLQVYNDPNLIVKLIILWPKDIATKLNIKKNQIDKLLTIDVAETILQALDKGQINKGEIREILTQVLQSKNIQEILKERKSKEVSDDKVELEILNIIKEKPGLSIKAYMGLIMAKFKGKIDAQKAIEILKKHVKE